MLFDQSRLLHDQRQFFRGIFCGKDNAQVAIVLIAAWACGIASLSYFFLVFFAALLAL